MKLIVGLGNPGDEYILTRHNVGFSALLQLVEALELKNEFLLDKKINARMMRAKLGRQNILMMMPQTFMNDSGTAVQAAMSFYKLTLADLLVIHDDKDIPLGETRMQSSRGPAGHNGVRSIIEKLGTENFMRIRIGVSPRDQKIIDTADFVLGKFTKEETNELKTIFNHVVSDVKTWLAS